jgi:hypothetical protein
MPLPAHSNCYVMLFADGSVHALCLELARQHQHDPRHDMPFLHSVGPLSHRSGPCPPSALPSPYQGIRTGSEHARCPLIAGWHCLGVMTGVSRYGVLTCKCPCLLCTAKPSLADIRVCASVCIQVDTGRPLRWCLSCFVHEPGFQQDNATVSIDHQFTLSSPLHHQVWDLASKKVIRSYDDHTGVVNTVAFHPDGTSSASAGSDNTIKVWDIRYEKVLSLTTLDLGCCRRLLHSWTDVSSMHLTAISCTIVYHAWSHPLAHLYEAASQSGTSCC